MIRKLRKKIKEEFLFIVFLISLFLLLSILSYLLINEKKEYNSIHTLFELQKTISSVLETFWQEGDIKESVINEEILGIGLYSVMGDQILLLGSAPAALKMPDILMQMKEPERYSHKPNSNRPPIPEMFPGTLGFKYDKNKKSISVIRIIKIRTKRTAINPLPAKTLPGVIFVEINTKAFWKKQALLQISFYLTLLIIIFILVTIRYIYKKNIRYRQRLESQKHLVHLGEAARTLTHEIKNPLSSIRIRTGILKKVVKDEGAEDLNVIVNEIDRLNMLTERISDFLKNPAGVPEIINTAVFIENLLDRFQKNISFTDFSKKKAFILFDRERLRSALENIINNAIESSDVKDSVEITLSCTKHLVIITVLDIGSGITSEEHEVIFDPFYTTKVKGSGIGLSITKRFVEAAQGTLLLHPREGRGTEARITLKREKQ